MIDAASGNLIQFAGIDTIRLYSGQLFIDKSVTIEARKGVAIVRGSTTPDFRIFFINGGIIVAFKNLTISNGAENEGGGVNISCFVGFPAGENFCFTHSIANICSYLSI